MGIIYFLLAVVFVSLGIYVLLIYQPDMDFLFDKTMLHSIIIGTPLALFAGLTAYYEKGEVNRLIFSMIKVALSIIYFVALFASINLGWEGDEFIYNISLSGLLVLIIIALVLNAIYHILEYIIHRPKYPEKVDEENSPPIDDDCMVT